jgi:putative hydroxymethylpyrimidine transport system substrate-binding protein
MKTVLTTLLLLAATPTVAQDRMTVMLDWFVNPDHGPIVVAQERGYFADMGLEVEIIAPANPADPPKIVAAGAADLAISYQPQLHLQVAEGMPLIRVGTLVATPLNCLLVLEDGPIEQIANLEGRKIGFSVSGFEEALLSTMLGQADLGMDDVELINVNWSLSPALMSGQVDAVIGAFRNFELNQMDIEGVSGRCFYPESEGVPTYDELIYVANPDTMDAEMIRRFLAATEKATQFIVNYPQESWEVFSSTSAASLIRLFSPGFEMATKVHGCRCAPEGAVPAVLTASSMSSRGTSRSEKWRVVRLWPICSWNECARESISSAGNSWNSRRMKPGSSSPSPMPALSRVAPSRLPSLWRQPRRGLRSPAARPRPPPDSRSWSRPMFRCPTSSPTRPSSRTRPPGQSGCCHRSSSARFSS